MARTPTLPPDDPRMWRRLLSRVHPDVGGPHELFIWTGAVRAGIQAFDPAREEVA